MNMTQDQSQFVCSMLKSGMEKRGLPNNIIACAIGAVQAVLGGTPWQQAMTSFVMCVLQGQFSSHHQPTNDIVDAVNCVIVFFSDIGSGMDRTEAVIKLFGCIFRFDSQGGSPCGH